MGWVHSVNTVLRFCFDAGSVLNLCVGMCAAMRFGLLVIMRGGHLVCKRRAIAAGAMLRIVRGMLKRQSVTIGDLVGANLLW